MNWEDDLETVVERTGHGRYRDLCAESHPNHRDWRIRISELARGPAPAPSYPPPDQQAKNLFRSALGFVRSGFKLAPRALRRERLAICQVCPKYDSLQKRCTVCGCANAAKVWVASDSCPLPEPRWKAV